MSFGNYSFIDRISYLLMWVAIAVAAISGIVVAVGYLRYGNTNFSRDNMALSLFVRFSIFAILVLVYRKIFIRK
jgi:cytochrome b subunit of formate dehydrogenase